LINLDQRWPSFRFTRKFWEFYLGMLLSAKEFAIRIFGNEIKNLNIPGV